MSCAAHLGNSHATVFGAVAIVLCTAVGLAVLVAVRWRGLIVPPCWRRPAQAALDSTQPA